MIEITPVVKKVIKSFMVRQNQWVAVALSQYFSPAKGVSYRIVSHCPSWLTLDPNAGNLEGAAPLVKKKQDFYLTVEAYNQQGSARQTFMISVVSEDFLQSLKRALEELTLKKRFYFPFEETTEHHELLEYLYEFLLENDLSGEFIETLELEAAREEIKFTSDPPTYEEFKTLVTALNPGIEDQLAQDFGDDYILNKMQVTNEEFRNACRQGGQALGSHVIPIWNYLAAADYHVWSAVYNVLDSAAEYVADLRQDALDNIQHKQMKGPRR